MKGILFTELLFNKTIAKKKTQTRREGSFSKINDRPDDFFIAQTRRLLNLDTNNGALDYVRMGENGMGIVHNSSDNAIKLKPRYKVGDVCYIKEPTGVNKNDCAISYMYDYIPESKERTTGKKDYGWQNKLFMPAHLARYYVKITAVKVERLFDISIKDVIAEGVDHDPDYDYTSPGGYLDATTYKDYSSGEYIEDYLESYLSLFRFANKIPKSKEIKNIWCWVYDYKLCDKHGNDI